MTISYLSGLWWLLGAVITYMLAVVLIEQLRAYFRRKQIREDRAARQAYLLSLTKDKERQ